jgi:hypothetical protein
MTITDNVWRYKFAKKKYDESSALKHKRKVYCRQYRIRWPADVNAMVPITFSKKKERTDNCTLSTFRPSTRSENVVFFNIFCGELDTCNFRKNESFQYHEDWWYIV